MAFRLRSLVSALLAVLCRVQMASAQGDFPVDTVTPHYARWNDELQPLLLAMSSVVRVGLDSTERAWLTSEIASIRPAQPRGRNEAVRSKTYLLTTGFRGRDAPLRLFVYWPDTNTVALRGRSSDRELERAMATAMLDARLAKLVRPDTVRLSVAELEPYNGAEPSLTFTMSVPVLPHCRAFGVERRMRWQGDTFYVQLQGVPAPGSCPSTAGLRSSSHVLYKGPGRYVIVVDSRGDTNVATLVVTDTSVALVPVRTTYLHAEQALHWRYPSASVTLRCHREQGDPHFCDALHAFIQEQPGVTPFRFPGGGVDPLGSGFAAERRMTYRYASEATAAKMRRCVASFPPQTRLDSWVTLLGRPVAGRWWAESPAGSSNSNTARRAPAEGLDASGNVPPECGDAAAVTIAISAMSPESARPEVRTTRVSTFEFKRTNRTDVYARSDGWIALAPLTSWTGRDSTTHLYARASEALLWVQRVRDVLSARSLKSGDTEANRFIQQLGRGTVKVNARVTDSLGHPRVSFSLNDCRGVARGYDVDGAALLAIAEQVERAAEVARAGSPIPVPPSPQRAYESTEVTCPAVALDAPAQQRLAELQRYAQSLRLRFVVDTAGRVEERSIKFVRGTGRAFAAAARADIAQWRYRPADWAGIRVRQVVRVW